MDFGQALTALHKGKRVARTGWNGQNMFIYLESGSLIIPDEVHNKALKGSLTESKKYVDINPHIDMKASDGSIVVGWLASQTDMLANDWEIVK